MLCPALAEVDEMTKTDAERPLAVFANDLPKFNEADYEEICNTNDPSRMWLGPRTIKTRIFARRDLTLDQRKEAAQALSDSVQDKTKRNPGHSFRY